MTKTKLLIVEDDEDIRTQMKWALGGDYEMLDWPGTALAALAAFTADRPAVTLLDLGLPPSPNDPRKASPCYPRCSHWTRWPR